MKITKFKSGTRQEILDYLNSKIVGTFDANDPTRPWFKIDGKNKLYQFKHLTVEDQIDRCIKDGSPLVSITLHGIEYNNGRGFREQFIVSDYGEIRIDMEMNELDNMELRDQRISAIKQVMAMELDAEERWNRILRIVDEFKGKTFTFANV